MPDKGEKEGWGMQEKKKKWSGMQILPFIYPDFYMKMRRGVEQCILTQHKLSGEKMK